MHRSEINMLAYAAMRALTMYKVAICHTWTVVGCVLLGRGSCNAVLICQPLLQSIC